MEAAVCPTCEFKHKVKDASCIHLNSILLLSCIQWENISLGFQIFLQRVMFQASFICSCLKLNWTTYQGNCAQVPQPLFSLPPPHWHTVQCIQAHRNRWASLSIISRHYYFFYLYNHSYQPSRALKYFNACRYAHYHDCVHNRLYTLRISISLIDMEALHKRVNGRTIFLWI